MKEIEAKREYINTTLKSISFIGSVARTIEISVF